jgi:hypothetical protein
MAVRTGALFTSLTIMVKLFESLKGGKPLSLTIMVIRLVEGPWDSEGVQLKIPVNGSRVAPAGALLTP